MGDEVGSGGGKGEGVDGDALCGKAVGEGGDDLVAQGGRVTACKKQGVAFGQSQDGEQTLQGLLIGWQ